MICYTKYKTYIIYLIIILNFNKDRLTYRAFFNQVSQTLRDSGGVGVGSRTGGPLDKILGGGHCLLDMLEPEFELLLQLQNALEVVEPGFQFCKTFLVLNDGSSK
jgi:hypothetical protein